MDEAPVSYEYYNQTTVDPLGCLLVVLMACAMFAVPRRHAIWPMIVVACFVAPAQRLYIAGMNFTFLRLMIMCGWARIMYRGEHHGFVWRPTDVVLVLWSLCGMAAYTVQQGGFAAFVNRLGESYDAIGMYFMFRLLIRDWGDLASVVKGFVLASIPVAGFFLLEHATGRNVFAIFGGVPEITVEREGRLRCQGAFAHPILAGTFWASLVPMIVTQWWGRSIPKYMVITGVLSSLIAIVMCASSGPLVAVALAFAGLCLFSLRRSMRPMRWGFVVALVGLHLVMKKPVWHLLSRVDIAGGSTGWHRYLLIEQAIDHFGEWCVIGTRSTLNWTSGEYALIDITNQYILEGVRGGLLTMLLFMVVIGMAFRDVGRLWRSVGRDRRLAICAWGLGVALFVHVVSFVSVSYFGQILMVWFLLLAAITSLSARTHPFAYPATWGNRRNVAVPRLPVRTAVRSVGRRYPAQHAC